MLYHSSIKTGNLTKNTFLAFSILLLLSLEACTSSGSDSNTGQNSADNSAPVLVDSNPKNSDIGIELNAALFFQFNEPLKIETISNNSIRLVSNNLLIDGTVEYSESTYVVTFTPNQPLSSDNTYDFVATTELADLAGNNLASEERIQFMTIDTLPPTIVKVSPTTLEQVATTTEFFFEFSERLDVSTITTDNVLLMVNSEPVAGSVTYDDQNFRVTFVPDLPVQFSQNYVFRAGSGIADRFGNSLGADQDYSFSTEPNMARINVNPDGTQANHNSSIPRLSENGRFVAFTSQASNLGSTARTGVVKIYLHDTTTKLNTLVTVTSDGSVLNGGSYLPSISADGRYVAFESSETNLIDADTNSARDIYVRDTQSNVNYRVSVSSVGNEVSEGSYRPNISANGQFVVFDSMSNVLTSDDNNSFPDVFLHDLQTRITERVSFAVGGASPNDASRNAAISGDGRYVVYDSLATNMYDGDTVANSEVYLYDRQTKTTALVSVSFDGTPVTAISQRPIITDDGRFIAFESTADNLVENISPIGYSIFVRDMQKGITEIVSVSSNGDIANQFASRPTMSNDGRFVAFFSLASNLVIGDTNNVGDTFVRDTVLGVTVRVNVAPDGGEANGASLEFTGISGDGNYIGFPSVAENLIGNKTNSLIYDVYRAVNPLR